MVQISGNAVPFGRVSLPMYNLPEMQSDNRAFSGRAESRADRAWGWTISPVISISRAAPSPPRSRPTCFSLRSAATRCRRFTAGRPRCWPRPSIVDDYCKGATHCGVFIVGANSRFKQLEDLRGCRFAYNSRHSNSGMNLPRRAIAASPEAGRSLGRLWRPIAIPATSSVSPGTRSTQPAWTMSPTPLSPAIALPWPRLPACWRRRHRARRYLSSPRLGLLPN